MHAPGVIKTLHSFQLPTSMQLEIFHFIEGVTWKMITFSFDKKLPSYFFASFITWYLDSNFISSGCPYNTTHFARIVFQNIKDSCKNVLLIVIRNNDFAWVILMVFHSSTPIMPHWLLPCACHFRIWLHHFFLPSQCCVWSHLR